MKLKQILLGATALSLLAAPGAQAAVSILNVSYDVTREFYKDVNTNFAAFWKQNGRVRKRYIKLADVDQMRELSEQPRRLLRDISKCNGYVRELRALVRGYEKLIKEFAGI